MIKGLFAIDYHVHSLRSHDAKPTIKQQCDRAVELGLDEIGFAEHKDFNPQDPVVGHFNYDLYMKDIEEARREFAGRLTIRMGVEIDYQDWFEDLIADYLKDHLFDFVIGSVHYAGGATLMKPKYVEGRSAEEAYRIYFDAVMASVESGFFNIVGHLEYANRRGIEAYGPYNPALYSDQVARIYDRMIAKGIALEINTGGLRLGLDVTYPCAEHIKLYAERGGKLLTIGSDAHNPGDLAESYTRAAQMALDAGLTNIYTWHEGKPTPVAIKHTS